MNISSLRSKGTSLWKISCATWIQYVEPPNKGHFGASHVVLYREAVLFSEVQNVMVLWEWYFEECPLQRGRPFLGGSFIRGSTVDTLPTQTQNIIKLLFLSTQVIPQIEAQDIIMLICNPFGAQYKNSNFTCIHSSCIQL